MKIPELTALQFYTLSTLLEGECSGRGLREQLAACGRSASAPSFYHFMSRLEQARFVEGRYDKKSIAGHTVRERVYRITGAGISAVEEFRIFAGAPRLFGLQGA
jgi:DNA-binding PadR family transcriptional regulator